MRRCCVVLLSILCSPLFAQEAKLQFEEANQLYRGGEYEKAASMYDRVVKNGYESAALYYNLGNAHFKLKNTPPAILNYERAKRLAPHDEDISYNLRLANLHIVDRIDPLPQLFFIEWWRSLIGSLASSGWSVLAIASLWCAAMCGAVVRLVRSVVVQRIFLGLIAASLLISVLGFTGTVQQYRHEHNDQTAIVFGASVSVKSSPDAQSTDLFVIHEGVKIELLDTVGEWKKIRLGDGKMGWMPVGEIQII